MKMQILIRNDGKKWTVWRAESKSGKAQKLKTKQTFEYFNSQDAITKFEELFLKFTDNKWDERDYF